MKKIITIFLLAFLCCEITAQINYQILQNTDMPSDAKFGSAVAVSDNYLAVSASRHDEEGSIYMYKNIAEEYELIQILSPDEVSPTELFGKDMDMSDTHLIVGGRGSASESGKAYIFELENNDWSLQKTLYSNQEFNNFGSVVKIDKQTCLITAPLQHTNSPYIRGMVEIHNLIDDAWSRTHIIAPPEDYCSSFGRGADIKGDWMAISAISKNPDTEVNDARIALYMYKLENNEWNLKQNIYFDYVEHWAFLVPGHNVAISDEQLIFSSWLRAPTGEADESMAQAPMVFNLQNDVWVQSQTITLDHQPDGNIGRAVSINNNFALIGVSENQYIQDTVYDSNAILLYETTDPDNWRLVADLPFEYNTSLQNSGFHFDTSPNYGVASTDHQPFEHGEVYIFNFKRFVDTKNLLDDKEVAIYPVPSPDKLIIETSTNPIMEYTIFSQMGQIMSSENSIEENKIELNISEYPVANYWIKIMTEDGHLYKQFSKI